MRKWNITYASIFKIAADQHFQIWLASYKQETDWSFINDNIITFNSLKLRSPLTFKIKDSVLMIGIINSINKGGQYVKWQLKTEEAQMWIW